MADIERARDTAPLLQLAERIHAVMVGGNHLASALISAGVNLPHCRDWSYDAVLERWGQPAADMWAAWKAIMDLRDAREQAALVQGRGVPQPQFPIPLTEVQEQAAKDWAADDRLWTTQETVEINLRTFARTILKLAAPAGGGTAPPHEEPT